MTLGGSESVHYIGIFSEDCDLVDVWTKLQSLGISPADVSKKGEDKVFVPFELGCSRIRDLGGIVTVHAGNKTNSIERMSNADIIKQAVKAEYLRCLIDAYEVGKVGDCSGYCEVVFPTVGRAVPLLLCSDNHDVRNYTPKCPMWIKADPGFAGLQQLLNSPSSRVYLGDVPEAITRAEQNATKYIDSIAFARTRLASEAENWFSGELSINHGLVAIIGNKGSGKSALADILALLGDTRANSKDFSFLRKDRFLAPKTKYGTMFRAEVSWKSGHVVERVLDQPVEDTAQERVKYIPQTYLETICSELKESSDTRFDLELMEVIFSHVSQANRLRKETLQELIAYLTSETEERIRLLTDDLSELNSVIVSLEDQATPEHKESLKTLYEQRLADLIAHDEAKPAEVKQPEQDPEAQKASSKITGNLSKLQKEVTKLEQILADLRSKEMAAAARVAAAEKLLGRIDNLEKTFRAFRSESQEEVRALCLSLDVIARLTIDRSPVMGARQAAEEERLSATTALDGSVEGTPAHQLAGILATIKEQRELLDEPNKRYHNYQEALKAWQNKRNAIEGNSETPNTVKGLQARLAALEHLPARIKSEKERRADLVREVYAAKEALLARYRQLYEPVQKFINDHPISKEHGALQFRASIAVERLVDGLLDKLHQGRKGSFQGEQEGHEHLQNLIASSDFTTADGALAFVEIILDHLEHDRRDGGSKRVRLRDQLRQNVTPEDVYDFLFGLSYLQPRYELRWQDKPLDQLSPGEQGNLLLVFYLLIDMRDTPLIIDQPEENLDNQTIAKMLVPAIKEAKERRQIIIVTHNPNLAVVCDADQVIHARLDKTDGNRVVYTSGALENPIITQLIVDVLEGTKPAFDLRDAVYEVLERMKNWRIAPHI